MSELTKDEAVEKLAIDFYKLVPAFEESANGSVMVRTWFIKTIYKYGYRIVDGSILEQHFAITEEDRREALEWVKEREEFMMEIIESRKTFTETNELTEERDRQLTIFQTIRTALSGMSVRTSDKNEASKSSILYILGKI